MEALKEPLLTRDQSLIEKAEQTERNAMLAMCHSYRGTMNEGEVYHHCFSEQICGLFCSTDQLFVNRLMVGSGELTGRSLDEVLAFYRQHRCPKLLVHVAPSESQDANRALVLNRGGKQVSNWVKHGRTPSAMPEVNTDVVVRPARKEEYSELGQLLIKAFGWPSSLSRFAEEGLGKGGWIAYLAESEGQIVGTGSLYVDGQAAALGIGATLPDFQRHGVQGALITARMAEAFRQGCKLIFSETIEPTAKNPAPSYRNMQRYGFTELYRRPNYVFELS